MAGIEIVAKDSKGNIKQEYKKEEGRVLVDRIVKPKKNKTK